MHLVHDMHFMAASADAVVGMSPKSVPSPFPQAWPQVRVAQIPAFVGLVMNPKHTPPYHSYHSYHAYVFYVYINHPSRLYMARLVDCGLPHTPTHNTASNGNDNGNCITSSCNNDSSSSSSSSSSRVPLWRYLCYVRFTRHFSPYYLLEGDIDWMRDPAPTTTPTTAPAPAPAWPPAPQYTPPPAFSGAHCVVGACPVLAK
jgi:hypothetical protein